MTYTWGNNHGSIMEVNGKWYVFYHRQTGTNEFARQAMLEPIDVAMGKDGMLYIGDVKYIKKSSGNSRFFKCRDESVPFVYAINMNCKKLPKIKDFCLQ